MGIIAFALSGILKIFYYGAALNDSSSKLTLAIVEAQTMAENLRNQDFQTVLNNYQGDETSNFTFDLTQIEGKGIVYMKAYDPIGIDFAVDVLEDDPELLELEIVINWKNENGRVTGEDQNLNGELDEGEDLNGNDKIDSTTTILTYLSKR